MASEPVVAISPAMPAISNTPPRRWIAAYLSPAPRAEGPALHTTSVEAIAISSQKMKRLIRSPANTTPMALPA